MAYQHQELAAGRWNELSLMAQLANTGSEVERAIKWKQKANPAYSEQAFFRALELLDLTLQDPKNRTRLREIARTREALVDYFQGENLYHSSDLLWQKYFFAFNVVARR